VCSQSQHRRVALLALTSGKQTLDTYKRVDRSGGSGNVANTAPKSQREQKKKWRENSVKARGRVTWSKRGLCNESMRGD